MRWGRNPMDKIFINRLRLDCIIGIYPNERIKLQPLEIDLEMCCDIRTAASTKDLNKSLNYAAISDAVIHFCQQAKAELLETLAEDLCSMLAKDFGVEGVKLTIHKPKAVPEAQSVGVSISRGNFC